MLAVSQWSMGAQIWAICCCGATLPDDVQRRAGQAIARNAAAGACLCLFVLPRPPPIQRRPAKLNLLIMWYGDDGEATSEWDGGGSLFLRGGGAREVRVRVVGGLRCVYVCVPTGKRGPWAGSAMMMQFGSRSTDGKASEAS